MEAYVGSIMLWPVSWAPDGWAFCQGQTMPVSQYAALYSLIGAMYGGDGQTTFALPDLRGRVPIGVGTTTPGTTPATAYILAQKGGVAASPVSVGVTIPAQQFTLNTAQVPLPAHTHSTPANTFDVTIPANNSTNGNTNIPGPTAVISKGVAVNGISNYPANIYNTVAANTNLAPISVTTPAGVTGANTPTSATPVSLPAQNITSAPGLAGTIQPFLGMNFIICLVGYYPPRP